MKNQKLSLCKKNFYREHKNLGWEEGKNILISNLLFGKICITSYYDKQLAYLRWKCLYIYITITYSFDFILHTQLNWNKYLKPKE